MFALIALSMHFIAGDLSGRRIGSHTGMITLERRTISTLRIDPPLHSVQVPQRDPSWSRTTS
jgi:hypothetical protein